MNEVQLYIKRWMNTKTSCLMMFNVFWIKYSVLDLTVKIHKLAFSTWKCEAISQTWNQFSRLLLALKTNKKSIWHLINILWNLFLYVYVCTYNIHTCTYTDIYVYSRSWYKILMWVTVKFENIVLLCSFNLN